jgi:hypothetical protein
MEDKNKGWTVNCPEDAKYHDKPTKLYPEGTFPGLSKDYGKSGPKEMPTNTPAKVED